MFPDPKSIFLRQSRKKAVKKKIMFSEKEKKCGWFSFADVIKAYVKGRHSTLLTKNISLSSLCLLNVYLYILHRSHISGVTSLKMTCLKLQV